MTIVVRRHPDQLDQDGPQDATEVCVVLLHLGGPTSLDSVESFYLDDWSGPGSAGDETSVETRREIAEKRFEEVKEQVLASYQRIGGASPVNEYVTHQARALENHLCRRPVMAAPGSGRFRVLPGFRFGKPDIASAVAAARDAGAQQVIGIPLYPLPAASTTGACVPEFRQACQQHGFESRYRLIESFSARPGFRSAVADQLRRSLDLINEELRTDTTILFSVVSDPLVRPGVDRFLDEVEATAQAILRGAGIDESRCLVGFLNRGGPGRWLEPSTRKAAADRVESGHRSLVILPLGWVTEDFDSLHELDTRTLAELAQLGLEKYRRVPLFNSDPEFIQLLGRLVMEQVGEAA